MPISHAATHGAVSIVSSSRLCHTLQLGCRLTRTNYLLFNGLSFIRAFHVLVSTKTSARQCGASCTGTADWQYSTWLLFVLVQNCITIAVIGTSSLVKATTCNICTKLFLMDIGLGGNIFVKNIKTLGFLAEHNWFTHLWQPCFIYNCNLTLDFPDNPHSKHASEICH